MCETALDEKDLPEELRPSVIKSIGHERDIFRLYRQVQGLALNGRSPKLYFPFSYSGKR